MKLFRSFFNVLNFLFLMLFFFSNSYSDINGIWINASDIRSGVFGSDENFGTFEFRDVLKYKGEDLENLYVNSFEIDSVDSLMIVDGEVKSEDIEDEGLLYVDFKQNDIVSEDIAIGGVDSIDVIDGSLISNRILDGEVKSADIKDNSLLNRNFFLGSIDSQKIKNDELNPIDVSFNYAGSNSKGGDALNSLKLNYEDWNLMSFIFLEKIFDLDNNNFYFQPNGNSIFGGLRVSNLYLKGSSGCRLYTDQNGNLRCGVDQVNDGDYDPTNELPGAGYGIRITMDNRGVPRVVNVDFSQVQRRVSDSCGNGMAAYGVDSNGNLLCRSFSSASSSSSSVPPLGSISFDGYDLRFVSEDNSNYKVFSGISQYIDMSSCDGGLLSGVSINNNGILEVSCEIPSESELSFNCQSGNYLQGFDLGGNPICGDPAISPPSTSPSLTGSSKTEYDCYVQGGVIVDSNSGSFCKFKGSSCPSGWTGNGYTKTISNTCRGPYFKSEVSNSIEADVIVGKYFCSTGSHDFSNVGVETCQYNRVRNIPGSFFIDTLTCEALISEIGCK